MPNTIISVGNITLGGTGKTPFAIMLARQLAERKEKVAVLIRGYGEDEWKMLEDKLGPLGVKVLVGRDRVKTANEALRCGAQTVILDDGFQHRRLGRDLDIALLDSASPFGNRHIFPRGTLRESPLNLKRADIIVLTKADRGKANIAAIEEEVKKISPEAPLIKAFHRPKELFELWKGGMRELSSIAGERVCILSAICDPEYFRHTVEKTGALVEMEFIFPDHHSYKKEDLEQIFEKCRARNAGLIITTEKDAVKLKKFAPLTGSEIFVLSVELEITEGKEKLDAELLRLYRRVPNKNL